MENAPQDSDTNSVESNSNIDDTDNECNRKDICVFDPKCPFYFDTPRVRGCRHYEPNRTTP